MNLKHFSKQRFFVACCALAMVTTGCIKEDLDACYKLTVKVVNYKGDEITEAGSVVSASLYVFDKELNYLQTLRMDADAIRNRQEITLDFKKSEELNIVAWGNMSEKSETVTEAQRIEELKVVLKSKNGVAVQADSLYFGNKLVVSKNGALPADDQIVLAPQTGSVVIRTEGLQNRLGLLKADAAPVCQYTLDRTLDQYTHKGELAGDSVYYNPDATWAGTEWNTEKYNAYLGKNLSVSLSANGQTIVDKVKTDDAGKPIAVEKGLTTVVVLRFGEDGALVSVRTAVRPWGAVIDNIEF